MGEKLSNAWFHTATLRTAGFNSFPLTSLRDSTVTIMMFLMFIGGCPGGTAGGIKITTAFVIAGSILATLRSRTETELFGKTIPKEVVYRATTVVIVGAAVLLVALISFQLIQQLEFKIALFEVISALGTVGLSLGATSLLDSPGKIVILLCMFFGRVGPLTVFILFARQRTDRIGRYADESVIVG